MNECLSRVSVIFAICCILVGIHSEDSLIQYGCCFNSSRSTFTLHLRRKYLYYLIHLIVPYCLFSLIAVFTFVLQPSRPERLNLGMASSFKPFVTANDKTPATKTVLLKITETKLKQINSECRYVLTQGVPQLL